MKQFRPAWVNTVTTRISSMQHVSMTVQLYNSLSVAHSSSEKQRHCQQIQAITHTVYTPVKQQRRDGLWHCWTTVSNVSLRGKWHHLSLSVKQQRRDGLRHGEPLSVTCHCVANDIICYCQSIDDRTISHTQLQHKMWLGMDRYSSCTRYCIWISSSQNMWVFARSGFPPVHDMYLTKEPAYKTIWTRHSALNRLHSASGLQSTFSPSCIIALMPSASMQ